MPPPSTPGSGDLQFERAEFTHGGEGPLCAACQRPAHEYFQFQGHIYCAPCRQRIESSLDRLERSASFGRAALYGVGAAIAGAALYYAVLAATGYEIGLVAVVVGLLVGKAVRKGSDSLGGWRYQALAMSLTYLSIVSSYVPGILKSHEALDMVSALALAIVAPLLGGFHDILGIVVIAIGLWEAWKFNRRVPVQFTGPFFAHAAVPDRP